MMRKPRLLDTPLTSQQAQGQVHSGLQAQPATWELPVETPVALRINGEDYAVMLCTPQDLYDFARGFVLSEAILPKAEAIQSLHIETKELGIQIDIQVKASALARQMLRQRKLAGRSGCGLCGVQSLNETMRPLPRLNERPLIAAQAIEQAFSELPMHQPIKQCNRSVHVAAWCDLEGHIDFSREDVGRHNALDKLIGALAVSKYDPAEGFAALSSRCSYELVQKAASFGIRALASLSAPTTLALQLATQANLQLSAQCADGVIIFNSKQATL